MRIPANFLNSIFRGTRFRVKIILSVYVSRLFFTRNGIETSFFCTISGEYFFFFFFFFPFNSIDQILHIEHVPSFSHIRGKFLQGNFLVPYIDFPREAIFDWQTRRLRPIIDFSVSRVRRDHYRLAIPNSI